MRHKVKRIKLSRHLDHKRALLRNLVAALFTHKAIVTTEAKARAARSLAERLIHIAKRGDLAARREVFARLPQPDIVRHLFDVIVPKVREREGGYTQILHYGIRKSDGARLVLWKLTDFEKEVTTKPEEKSAKQGA